ncbi:hypothetical protein ACJJTC_019372 [Scirpophaga incertulas]
MDSERRLTVAVIRRLIILIEQTFRLLLLSLQITLQENEEDNLAVGLHLVQAEISSTIFERTTPIRINNYIDFIIPRQTADQFKNNFRMTLAAFEVLLSTLGPLMIATNKHSPVTKLMDPRKQLLAVLWLLSTPDSYRSVAERFDMGKSSLHHSFMVVVKLLNSLSNKIIKWPTGYKLTEIEEKFKSDLHKNVSQGKIIIPQDHFIIGDKAYPTYSWCIPPFIERGTLTFAEKNFNTAHAKTRQCIERAFALLKGRFRRLKYLDMSRDRFYTSCYISLLCLT